MPRNGSDMNRRVLGWVLVAVSALVALPACADNAAIRDTTIACPTTDEVYVAYAGGIMDWDIPAARVTPYLKSHNCRLLDTGDIVPLLGRGQPYFRILFYFAYPTDVCQVQRPHRQVAAAGGAPATADG